MFSIIIPLYNCASYLSETIASIASQTFTDFEVIAVDDQSDDRSFELAESLIAKFNLRGSVYRKTPDQKKGVSSSRNLGIRESRGEWVCFLDSDDLFHAAKLNILNETIRANPSIQFYHHSVYQFKESDTPDLLRIIERSPVIDPDSLYDQNNVVTSSVSVSRNLLQMLGGFNEKLNGIEDYHLWLKISTITNLEFIPERLGFYRIRKNSLMGSRRFAHYVDQSILLLNNIRFLSEERRKRVIRGSKFTMMNYYSNTSIQRHGYLSLFPGLFRLVATGHLRLAVQIFLVKSRNRVLYKLKSGLAPTQMMNND